LRHHAVVEDVDYRAPRGLDRALFHKLAGGEWIDVPGISTLEEDWRCIGPPARPRK
jgi:hypothetical protein